MSSIKEKIIVRGSTEKVFDALTSNAGYNGWWSKDCQIAEKPGGESKLKFNKNGTIVAKFAGPMSADDIQTYLQKAMQ